MALRILLTLLLAVTSLSLYAQPAYCPIQQAHAGMVDSCYAWFDKGEGLAQGYDDPAQVIKSLPGGKLLIGGSFVTYNGQWRRGLARLNANGTLDSTFRTNPGFAPAKYPTVVDMAVQADGKIIVTGQFDSYDGTYKKNICRLLPGGSLDADYQPHAAFSSLGVPTGLLLLPNGKALVSGKFTWPGGKASNLIRIDVDGKIDTAFKPDSVGAITAIARQSNGNIIYTSANNTHHSVGALDSNGRQVPGFAVERLNTAYTLLRLIILPDDRILAWKHGSMTAADTCIVRLKASGGLDTTFRSGVPPSSLLHEVQVATLDDLGNILLSGLYQPTSTSQAGVIRLLPDGGMDSSLNLSLLPEEGRGIAWCNEPAPHMVVSALGHNKLLPPLVALSRAGAVQPDFNPAPYPKTPLGTLTLYPGNRVITGLSGAVNAKPRTPNVRLMPDGFPDTTFRCPKKLNSIVVQPGGRMLGLEFTGFGLPRYTIFQLDSTGQPLDSADLAPPGYIGLTPYYKGKAIASNSQGDLIILNAQGHPARTLSSSQNTVFQTTTSSGSVYSIAPLPEGSLIISGRFDFAFGKVVPGLVKIDSLGNVDTAFVRKALRGIRVSPTPPSMDKAVIGPDGKILLMGNIRLVDSVGFGHRAIRLNADGSLDPTFHALPFTPFVNPPGRMAVQSDGKVLLCSEDAFTSNLFRLNQDGTRDTSFKVEDGIAGVVGSILPLPGVKRVLITGDITRVGGKPRSYIAQLFTDAQLVPTQEILARNKALKLYPNPTTGLVWVETTGNAQLLALDGRILQETTPANGRAAFDLKLLDPGLYLVRSGGQAARVVKE